MELNVIVNATHLGGNIFSITLPKFPVHSILIAYTKTMLFCLEMANHSNKNLYHGDFR